MKTITFPKDNRGCSVRIKYIKSQDVICIDVFYNDFIKIEGTEISVADFAEWLRIDLKRNRE